jgi:hypothetical protein
MTELVIDDALAARLESIAQREARPLQEVLHAMADKYETKTPAEMTDEEYSAALNSFIGMSDDEVTDASMTVRETMAEIYRRKYDGTGPC